MDTTFVEFFSLVLIRIVEAEKEFFRFAIAAHPKQFGRTTTCRGHLNCSHRKQERFERHPRFPNLSCILSIYLHGLAQPLTLFILQTLRFKHLYHIAPAHQPHVEVVGGTQGQFKVGIVIAGEEFTLGMVHRQRAHIVLVVLVCSEHNPLQRHILVYHDTEEISEVVLGDEIPGQFELLLRSTDMLQAVERVQ